MVSLRTAFVCLSCLLKIEIDTNVFYNLAMDLFPVTRYLGDEEDVKKDPNALEKNRSKLLSKIHQRSKLKSNPPNLKENPESFQDAQMSPIEAETKSRPKAAKKKHKKIKLNDEDSVACSDREDFTTNESLSSTLVDQITNLTVAESNENFEQQSEEAVDNSTDVVRSELFKVLGDYKFTKKTKVNRVLPEWLANPSVVSVDLKNLSVSVGDISELDQNLVNALRKNEISHFFPVQAQVIPFLLKSAQQSSFVWSSDICVSAPTGSGKTLAYVLPILQVLSGGQTGQVQALVVLPVQELAAQVAAVFRLYGEPTGVRVHLSTGAQPLHADRQQLLKQRLGAGWESRADVLVITPGRLVEHLYSTPGFTLDHLRYVVIDEADRIVDNMQNNWLHHLDRHLAVQGCPQLALNNLRTLPRRPQKLLFSATLSIDPEKLNQLHLFQPRLFTSVVEATKDKGSEGEFIGKFTTPAELTEQMVECTLNLKPLVLFCLLARKTWLRVLVFTSSCRATHKLCALLKALVSRTDCALTVAEISAECSPEKRRSTLKSFESGKVNVLITSDALARGIDVLDIQCVVLYDMPKHVKAYVHRVGRTGRAGRPGTAVTMVTHSQVKLFKQMLLRAGKEEIVTELTIEDHDLKELEEPFKESLLELQKVSKEEKVNQLHNAKITKSKGVNLNESYMKKRRKQNENWGNQKKRFKGGSFTK